MFVVVSVNKSQVNIWLFVVTPTFDSRYRIYSSTGTCIIADLCSSSEDHGSREPSSRQQCRLYIYIYATTCR
jgi:hypothetical protein